MSFPGAVDRKIVMKINTGCIAQAETRTISCVHVCVCVCVCVRACVRACVRVCVRASVCVF